MTTHGFPDPTPSLAKIKAHLGRVGHTLCFERSSGCGQAAFILYDASKIERGRFACLCQMWRFWRSNAARILYDDVCIRRFLSDFRRSSASRRQVMADAFVERLSGEQNMIDCYTKPRVSISADGLPRNWQAMLERNLNGDIQALGFFSYVKRGMRNIDPSIVIGKSPLELSLEAHCTEALA